MFKKATIVFKRYSRVQNATVVFKTLQKCSKSYSSVQNATVVFSRVIALNLANRRGVFTYQTNNIASSRDNIIMFLFIARLDNGKRRQAGSQENVICLKRFNTAEFNRLSYQQIIIPLSCCSWKNDLKTNIIYLIKLSYCF